MISNRSGSFSSILGLLDFPVAPTLDAAKVRAYCTRWNIELQGLTSHFFVFILESYAGLGAIGTVTANPFSCSSRGRGRLHIRNRSHSVRARLHALAGRQ